METRLCSLLIVQITVDVVHAYRTKRPTLHPSYPMEDKLLLSHLALKSLSSVQAGGDVNAQTQQGWAPLHLSTKDNRLQVVEELLAAGADSSLQDSQGRTALHFSARIGDVTMFQTIFKHPSCKADLMDCRGKHHLTCCKPQLIVSCLFSEDGRFNRLVVVFLLEPRHSCSSLIRQRLSVTATL